MSDGRGHNKVSVAVRPAAGADAAVEHGMITSVQTHTDAEGLVVKAIRLFSLLIMKQILKGFMALPTITSM